MVNKKSLSEIEIINQMMSMLANLEFDGRKRVLTTVATYYDFDLPGSTPEQHNSIVSERGLNFSSTIPYSEPIDLSPKEFLRQKEPQTDVERLACLAYYLTHYRDISYFKTLDLSKLNTEAAQPKFSNAAKSTANAMQYGYLAQSIKGHRKISAAGEDFVNALPDRNLAKAAIASGRPKRRKKRENKSTTN